VLGTELNTKSRFVLILRFVTNYVGNVVNVGIVRAPNVQNVANIEYVAVENEPFCNIDSEDSAIAADSEFSMVHFPNHEPVSRSFIE